MNEPTLLAALDAVVAAEPDYVPRTRNLDADGRPQFTNALILETSPYLRQHAHNPVNWQAWGPAAFEEARLRDVPVLLSVGYSTCHWCHVMEHESFEEPALAEFMNAHFVPVKVDREERPDVDACYMDVLQAMSGSGGWPMTVFLTPDGAPLFAGTYFPPHDGHMGHRPGFGTIMSAIATRWREPAFAVQGAGLLRELAARAVSPAAQTIAPAELLPAAVESLDAAFDTVHGGFGHAPKFPRPAVLDYLLRMHVRLGDGDARCLRMVTTTLTRMACGGLYDHVAGGFARYSTDARWLVPHFEKMLYDNAQLVSAYVEAWQVTGEPFFEWVARDTLAWLDREMSHPDGGFLAATDADSEGEEGRFFLWTPAELDAALPPRDARWVKDTFDVTAHGNFEDRNILNLRHPLAGPDLARWGTLRRTLRTMRERRIHPGVDTKIVTAWNGLAISAFAQAGRAFADPALIARAARAADFVLIALADPSHPDRLLRTFCRGQARHLGVLEDQAAMVGACVDLLQATGELRFLGHARRLQVAQDAAFADPEHGGYFRAAHDAEPLPIREKPDYDGAEPSGNALSAINLLRLAEIDGGDSREKAEGTLRSLDRLLRQAPTTVPKLLCALDLAHAERKQIVLTGNDTSAFEDVLRRRFLPHAVVLRARPGDEIATPPGWRPTDASEAPSARLLATLPLFEGRVRPDGRAVAYVCVGTRCEAPVDTPEALEKLL